jgi:DNA-binding protein Fis
MKREICERELRKAHGNQAKAAIELKINVRTLRDWVKAWGL